MFAFQADLVPMSLPFNLSALLFLCVTTSRSLARPQVISFPEKHRLEYKQRKLQQVSISFSFCYLPYHKDVLKLPESMGGSPCDVSDNLVT